MLIFGYIYLDSAPPDNYNNSEGNCFALLCTKTLTKNTL